MTGIMTEGKITHFGTLREGVSQKSGQAYCLMDVHFTADGGSKMSLTLRDGLARQVNANAVLHGDQPWQLFFHIDTYEYTNRNGYVALGNEIVVDNLQPVIRVA